MSTLALHGGTPVRKTLLPYAHQSVSEEDIAAVTAVLKSDWWTTGPNVAEFEQAFAAVTHVKEAVAVSNGTAALHVALYGAGIGPGDEVIVPPMTFAATANAAVFLGAKPVFVDCDPDTLLLNPAEAEKKITEKTKAIMAVDYAGQPCDYDALRALAEKHKLTLVADACHALGGAEHGKPVGSLADISTFSFHPVKPLATGEGGMVTTDDPEIALRMRRFRNHCMTTDHRERQEKGSWFYEVVDLGYNYRLTDIQCALGLSQLKRVPEWTKRRQAIAKQYDAALKGMNGLCPLAVRKDVQHAYHLYVIQLELERLTAGRNEIFQALRAENIGVNVHYVPVHLHPYYRRTFGTAEGLCPVAERAYERIISLPMFAAMTEQDAQDVIEALKKVLSHYAAQ
ncbi:MAG TPA: UDP-4-amino-4,6-dideoxy-N-acetyl-beta-L-altrosamine transaminase [Candidatus Peribacter riflensis]|uniref:DegT/DnrJ/EryC1/StrS aminotransferase n=1 Tax=Candidatus Peribacter riflensis TaxID=1735162 RepID=A0A0S1SW95_9BACT|nr:MAG: DegT/DnrJ/EryC1/StrS aminotransferase [Candidatus Peribacter riflensis]ALM11420.1 MAG: DegT/DnrJ/EryC1/StrS aminotransferase [Candidatus Peribacter riflensis]ALM12522.1 MAG: DegT/DnrJ/EryC1/StrS aminotransferase [Candidatus Peribacter riflensis]ALM13623.1 MAG: DegT/DnrJ/EryC1/StrS aminotransferase [Candidatus Peribacter riflensis]ALM14726.1 MAG: DegT/DnrJ/EryC1/StrS aminotransferase [Candidatus Peribacter riflensis]